MAFLSDEDSAQLREIFSQNLADKVRVRLFTQPASKLFLPGAQQPECATCEEAQQLLQEVADLSDKVELSVHDVKLEPELARSYGVDGALPSFVLERAEPADDVMGKVRFLGLPAGYEFSVLVAGLVDVSNRHVDLSPEAQADVRDLQGDVHIQVFVTPT